LADAEHSQPKGADGCRPEKEAAIRARRIAVNIAKLPELAFNTDIASA
jgi:hypothetical protein